MVSKVKLDLVPLISDWIDCGRGEYVDLGLSVTEACTRACALLKRLSGSDEIRIGAEQVELDVLYGALELLRRDCTTEPVRTLEGASRIWEILKNWPWEKDEFGEQEDLICSVSFLCWRSARLLDRPREKYKWEAAYRSTFRASLQWEAMCSQFLLEGRDRNPGEDLDAEKAFQTLIFLQDNCDAVPETVGSHAIDLYYVIDSARAALPADITPFLAGSSARIAGAAMRQCGVPDEASRWLDIAKAELQDGICAQADLAKVTYQQLALLYRLSRFDLIESIIPSVDKAFVDLGMQEDHVKCRILWASSLKIAGRCDTALEILEPLRAKREKIPPALYGWILLELGDLHQIGGCYERGIAELTEAAELLKDNNHFTGLADVTAMLAAAYRSQGMLSEALELFQRGRNAYAQLGMKSLEAYIRLLLAETFLAMGNLAEAEREVVAALPTLQEHRMLAEATAGLSLLREVTRRRRLDPGSRREEGIRSRKR